jgi:hypothetical protein
MCSLVGSYRRFEGTHSISTELQRVTSQMTHSTLHNGNLNFWL